MGSVAKWLGVLVAAALVVPATQNPGVSATSETARPNTTSEPWQLSTPQPLDGAQLVGLIDGVGPLPQLADTTLAKANTAQAEAERLWQQGLEHFDRSQFREAIAAWEAALEQVQAAGNRWGEGVVLNALGLAHRNLGRVQRAIGLHQEALAIAQEIGDRAGESRALGSLGIAYFSLGQYERAIDLYQQQLEITREIGDRAGEGAALGNLGNAYNRLGQYERAIDFYEQQLAIAREIGDRQGEGAALGNLGGAYLDLGDYQQSINFSQQWLAIAREIGNRAGEGRALGNLSGAYLDLGDYQQSINFSQQWLAIAREIGDRQGEGAALGNLGGAYLDLGDYAQSINLLQQRLAIAREIGDRQGEGNALGNLGIAYLNLGNYAQSINFSQQLLAIAREIGYREGEGAALGNLGHAYRNLGDYQQSINLLQQRLAIAREIGDREGEGAALGNLGLAYRNLGDYAQSINLLQQQLAIAREIGNRKGEGAALGNLGIAYLNLGNYAQSINFSQQLLAIAREIGSRQGEGIALNNLGAAYLQSQQPAQAETVLLQAVAVLDDLRSGGLSDGDQVSLLDTQQNTFRLLQQALVAQGKYEPALTIAERGRARAFVELLSQRIAIEEAAVAAEPPNIEAIQALAQQQQTTLVNYSLIQFSDDDAPALYTWVVSPDGSITFRQQPLSDINLTALVTNTRDAIGGCVVDRATAIPTVDPNQAAQDLAQSRAETDENLRQLHQILIDPIADFLPTDPNQKVAFIPQGELFLVPFPALKDANGQYLIENHTILTAPSIQVLQLTHDLSTRAQTPAPLQADNPLIVGDPAMPTVTFLSEAGSFEAVRLQPLYGARQEAEAVGKTLNASALLGDAATEARVKQQIASADLIHLATHGLLEYGDPRQTGSRDTPGAIALAPGNGEDGLLTSTEILQMELQADLVVLSACDTGRGRITGDGVIGLSRSFIAAGVPSVIVSLWAVPDAPTAELMSEFYDQLAQGQTKAQALRQAMLITMQTRPDPKDWAAFTLIGNAE
jgi:CHAT domain-containing protein/lipopolysaccharide biosynthesis regulator YciM